MEDEVKDGGAAFPSSFRYELEDWSDPGMSLRDWFAGQAMMGIIANPHNERQVTFEQMAKDAYVFADALLSARKDTQ